MYTHTSKEMYTSLAEVFGSENNVVARKQKSYASFAATIVDLLGKNNVPAMTLFDDQGHALVYCVAGLPESSDRARAAFAPWTKGKGGSGTGDGVAVEEAVVLRLDVGFFSRMKRSADDARRRWLSETRQLLSTFGVDYPRNDDEFFAFIDMIPDDKTIVKDGQELTVRDMIDSPPVPVFLLDFVCSESTERASESVSRFITLRVL